MGVQIPIGRGNFEGKEQPVVKYRDTAVRAVRVPKYLMGTRLVASRDVHL